MKARLHHSTQTQFVAVLHARSGSYVFHGPRSVGKATAALELAQQLNCLGHESEVCGPCHQFEANSYPDLIVIRPEDKPSILIEQVRTLTQALSLSLYYSEGIRVVVIDDAHLMTTEAQNALLKLIEEPPPQTIFVLVAERLESLLPTVRSRCGSIFFSRLTEAQIADLLTQEYNIKPSTAAAIAATVDGAPGTAVTLASDSAAAQERLKLVNQVNETLSRGIFERLLLAGQLVSDKADLARFGYLLHTHLVNQVRIGTLEPQSVSRQLLALERFRRALSAKVAPRVVVERLMLELP